jgi:hypothetical protein
MVIVFGWRIMPSASASSRCPLIIRDNDVSNDGMLQRYNQHARTHLESVAIVEKDV